MSTLIVTLALCGTVGAVPPTVHSAATFQVKEQLGLPYAQGVLCDPVACHPGDDSCESSIYSY